MSYYDNFNPTLLDHVAPAARTILEFGCGGGALARAVRDKLGPAVYYAGVDVMAEALERAAPVLDDAIRCDLDGLDAWDAAGPMAPLLERRFDHIIFGDVLEHLKEPERLLANAARHLAPGGTVLACIPNVQHWSVFVQLMAGSWPRTDSGIFDRTHLRWFALGDMGALMERAGLAIETVVGRVFDEERGREIAEYLEPLAIHLGLDYARLVQQVLPLQYVMVARRAAGG